MVPRGVEGCANVVLLGAGARMLEWASWRSCGVDVPDDAAEVEIGKKQWDDGFFFSGIILKSCAPMVYEKWCLR